MGGAGTTCVALNPTGHEGKFSGIASFQWLWILFVLIGITAGIMGVRAVVMLVKGRKHSYRAAIAVMLLGIAINSICLPRVRCVVYPCQWMAFCTQMRSHY